MNDFQPADAPYPPLPPSDRLPAANADADAAIVGPTRDNPEVTYGSWEPDPDATQRYQGFLLPLQGIFGGVFNIEPRRINGWRRARYETWWENGRRMGRWHWERDDAP